MSGEYEKIKNMTPEELREYQMRSIQQYRETVEHIDDPELGEALLKAVDPSLIILGAEYTE